MTTVAATELPLVLPCRGGTSPTQLAAEVGEELGRLGAAEPTGDAEAAVTAARRGRNVVALDGCASACRARLLEARGVRAQQALVLDQLGGGGDVSQLARAASARLRRRGAESPTRARIRRPALPRAAGPATRAHDVNDYLLAIDALASASVECGAVAADAPTLAAHVSQLLGISRASAGEALARLQARGLVARGSQKQIVLTPRGRLAADRVVRRQRLLERFAVDYLGYTAAECFEEARVLERAFDDDAIERLADKLGSPERCPHGWPVDPLAARAENEELATLLALPVGTRATIARVSERDHALVGRLVELDLVPGSEVVVERRSDDVGVAVRVGGVLRELETNAATGVLVRATLPEAGR
jgi:DtxR family Mn-dependent transcriptional regulator